MGLMRLGLSNPSANTDVAIYTATGPFLASIIATNKSASVTSNIRIWVVPSGATLTSQYAYLAYDQDIVPQNSLETHRFALNQNDVVYVRADTADMSFIINGLKQVDIALAAGVTSYSNTPPLDVMDGMIWVDKDGNGTALPDTFLKQTSSTSFGESSTVNINTRPWNMPWGIISVTTTATQANVNTATLTDIPGMTNTFTAISGRLYRATFAPSHVSGVSGERGRFFITGTNISNVKSYYFGLSPGSAGFSGTFINTFSASSSGSTTVKIQFCRDSGSNNMNVYADAQNLMLLIIEDIGPA